MTAWLDVVCGCCLSTSRRLKYIGLAKLGNSPRCTPHTCSRSLWAFSKKVRVSSLVEKLHRRQVWWSVSHCCATIVRSMWFAKHFCHRLLLGHEANASCLHHQKTPKTWGHARPTMLTHLRTRAHDHKHCITQGPICRRAPVHQDELHIAAILHAHHLDLFSDQVQKRLSIFNLCTPVHEECC